jgi:hypothetical protein
MSDRSAIEWTDATWNPVRGCTKVSPGCKFCYAELFAKRFRGVPGHPSGQGFDLRLVPEKLDQPLHWRHSRKIFVNSMSDSFHEDVPADYIARVGDVMRRADWHVFKSLLNGTSEASRRLYDETGRRSDRCPTSGAHCAGQGREAPSAARAALTRAIAPEQSRFGASASGTRMGIKRPGRARPRATSSHDVRCSCTNHAGGQPRGSRPYT